MKRFVLLLILISVTMFSCNSQTISAKKVLKLIAKGKDVVLENKTIAGELDLSSLQGVRLSPKHQTVVINSNISFINCHFTDKVKLFSSDQGAKNVQIRGNLSFYNCQIDADVDLTQVEIYGDFRFQNNKVNGQFIANGSKFYGFTVYLNQNRFSAPVRINSAYFLRDVNMMDNQFEDYLDLTNTTIGGIGNLANSSFQKALVLSMLKVNDLNLNYLKLKGKFVASSLTVGNQLQLIGPKIDSVFRMEKVVVRNSAVLSQFNVSDKAQVLIRDLTIFNSLSVSQLDTAQIKLEKINVLTQK